MRFSILQRYPPLPIDYRCEDRKKVDELRFENGANGFDSVFQNTPVITQRKNELYS
jgi:hypothetical protein